MNREIEFRGKSIYTKEWVYGYLIGNDLITSGIKINCPLDLWENIKRLEEWEEVDPETVGQYVGEKDKNGKKYYEGDIYFKQGFWEYYIGFENGKFVAVPLNIVQRINHEHFVLDFEFLKDCEIIGNIYDNREILNAQFKLKE